METNTPHPRVMFATELRNLVKRWYTMENACDIIGTVECVKADFLSPGKGMVTSAFSMEMRQLVARWCDQADFTKEDVVGVLECEKFIYLMVTGRWITQQVEAELRDPPANA